MRICIFGLTVSSSWGNGHATLWRGLIRSLAAAGHELTFFEKDVPWYASARDASSPEGCRLVLYPGWQEIEDEARREIARSDVAMVTSYCPDALAATDEVLGQERALRVFYDLDTPVTLDRLAAGERVEYIGSDGLRAFDLVLSYTGGRALDALRERLGARNVAPLYGSVDPAAHRPAAPTPHYAADLSYMGTFAADRQQGLSALMLEPAQRLPRKRFLIAGAQYPVDFPWSPNIFFVRHLPPGEHPAFFSSCALTLNIPRRAMAELGYCPSGRLFEAAACGAPMLSDWWEGIEQFLEPGRELLIARSAEEAVEALAIAPAELKRIAEAARRRVLAEHTNDRRAQELVGLLESAGAPRTRRAGRDGHVGNHSGSGAW